jgi:hypothetical protein
MLVLAAVKPFSLCFWHAALGIFSVLFFVLSGAGTIFGLYMERRVRMKNVSDLDLVRPIVDLRFKFDAAYFGIGTILLFATFLLGVHKAGFGNPKSYSTLFVLAYALLLPVVARLVPQPKRRRVVQSGFFLGAVLALLNVTVGNFWLTSFHNYL